MRKFFAILTLLFVIIVVIVVININNFRKESEIIAKFNAIYEEYNKNDLNGLDMTTIINKAISNNEKYNIQKTEEGSYISDEMYSIKIYIKMIINEKTYEMEKINEIGMNSFVEYFGQVHFKCVNIQYHDKTGRVSEMIFESIEY